MPNDSPKTLNLNCELVPTPKKPPTSFQVWGSRIKRVVFYEYAQKRPEIFFKSIKTANERAKPRHWPRSYISLKYLNWRCAFRGQDWIVFLTFDDCSLYIFFVCTSRLTFTHSPATIVNWNFKFCCSFSLLIILINCAPVSNVHDTKKTPQKMKLRISGQTISSNFKVYNQSDDKCVRRVLITVNLNYTSYEQCVCVKKFKLKLKKKFGYKLRI